MWLLFAKQQTTNIFCFRSNCTSKYFVALCVCVPVLTLLAFLFAFLAFRYRSQLKRSTHTPTVVNFKNGHHEHNSSEKVQHEKYKVSWIASWTDCRVTNNIISSMMSGYWKTFNGFQDMNGFQHQMGFKEWTVWERIYTQQINCLRVFTMNILHESIEKVTALWKTLHWCSATVLQLFIWHWPSALLLQTIAFTEHLLNFCYCVCWINSNLASLN